MIPAFKKHNRKLGLCGAALTEAKNNRNTLIVMSEVANEVEQILELSNYLDNAPFEWVTVSLRFGLKYEDLPHYEQINKKYGDLPLAIELDSHDLVAADREELKRLFTIATLKSLIHAGDRYDLPTRALKNRLHEVTVT